MDILFEEISGKNGNIGLVTLNRPQVLNALNHAMFIALHAQLSQWETADHIKAVAIRAAEGRAFCAGGDIRSAYEKKLAEDPTLPHFFRDEYQLDTYIYNYPKPYIALLDGITMGGGVGISINGSHRVATEKLLFAMPETGIGFYPDVGGSYFLSRLPHKMGLYLGLVGARINYSDCMALGLVDHIVSRDQFEQILYALADASLQNNPKEETTAIIDKFSIAYPESSLLKYTAEIESCFSKNTVEEIFSTLENHPSEWCKQTLVSLKTKSPTSLKVSLRALHIGLNTSFNECMRMEYCLTNHFLEGHDFFEGIRAAIIDKDQKPQWKPAHLDEVSSTEVEEYFHYYNNKSILSG